VKKVFLDSDIILDVLLKRPGFYLPAANLIALAGRNQVIFITSPVAFLNVHYFLDKFDKANKLPLLKGLRKVVSIIEVGEAIIDAALKSDFTDTEDAVQYLAAKSANADYIITRNIKDYKQSTLPILTAEQFLNTLS
jgi:predicted nucleic acid-binding protein